MTLDRGLGCFGEVSSSCLSAEDCSLIIDHQTVFNCQTSKTSARQQLCECLPSFTPPGFILKGQMLPQQEEVTFFITLENLSRKVI